MTLSEDLRSAGVITYNTVKDVPYVRDDSWGSFKGSYGTVYRATTKRFAGREQVYAIKEIQAISRQDQLMVAQEIKFLRQFRHPNILELQEAFVIDLPGHQMLHTIRLVTRPWAPVSLHHFIQDLTNSSGSSTICSWFRPQELDPWFSIVRQCLNGLDYLHSQQPKPIRHKDIKPHNILLYSDVQESGRLQVRPIIIDFGISKEHVDGATTANTGTYEYKAPEQIKNQEPTLASDVFSLGCCFALIEGILRPWPKLLDVYDAAMGTDSCQFANNVTLINDILQVQHTASADSDSPALGFFCTQFRGLVRDMLKKEPVFRPSASRALDSFNEIDSDLARFLDNPTLELCITLRGEKTRLVEIGLSECKTDGHLFDELDRRYTDVAISQRGRIASRLYRVSAVRCVTFTLRDPDYPTVQIDELSPSSSASLKHRWSFNYLARFMNRKNRKYSCDPGLYHETSVRDRVPKRFGQSSMSRLTDTQKVVHDWGLEILEDMVWEYPMFLALLLWIMSGCVVTVICTMRKNDSQWVKVFCFTWTYGPVLLGLVSPWYPYAMWSVTPYGRSLELRRA